MIQNRRPHRQKKKKNDVPLEPSGIELDVEDSSRTVYLVGEINEDLILSVTERLVTLSEKNPLAPIHMIINTYGGNVDDTFMLYDLMKYIPTPIHTVGLGKIMSAGCLLLAAGKKGERKIGRNARMMYHCGYEVHGGSIFELKANVAAFELQELEYDKRFSEETGMSLEDVEKLYSKHGPTADKYITAEEAYRLGVVDGFI